MRKARLPSTGRGLVCPILLLFNILFMSCFPRFHFTFSFIVGNLFELVLWVDVFLNALMFEFLSLIYCEVFTPLYGGSRLKNRSQTNQSKRYEI